jgi:hypothetical protein
VQNAKLTAARGSSTAIGEIDDLSLPDSIDGGVGLFDKTLQAFGKPVIPASLLAVAIHSLLDDNPLATVGHNEPVQIEIKAILHGGAIDLGDEPDRICECRPIKAHTLPIATSSRGVCRECLPRPPQTWIPSSFESGAKPRFKAPITLVVMPEECQSMPITAPKDWNQKGWARRRSSSSRP